MAEKNEARPIIIKRVKGGGHGGHHGGAWKVAYADFVTAMMAFFLLLWLLNVTTSVQKQGIADYFAPAAVSSSNNGSGGMFGGKTLSPDGANSTDTTPVSQSTALPATPGYADKKNDDDAEDMETNTSSSKSITEDQAAKEVAKHETEQFQKAADDIMKSIEASPDLNPLAKNIMIDQNAGRLAHSNCRSGKPINVSLRQ